MPDTYTPNLNLKKPGYDSPADIADINANMDKIDASVSQLSEQMAEKTLYLEAVESSLNASEMYLKNSGYTAYCHILLNTGASELPVGTKIAKYPTGVGLPTYAHIAQEWLSETFDNNYYTRLLTVEEGGEYYLTVDSAPLRSGRWYSLDSTILV